MTRDEAFHEAMRTSIDSIAGRLQEVLGQKITAYAIGVKDPRTIGRWARTEQSPRESQETRLRALFSVTQLLQARESPETVRAWLLGANPLLDGRTPVELLHEDDRPPVARTATIDAAGHDGDGYGAVFSAAEEFVREP
jgi:Protein of unknown function (DUF2384)